MGQLLSRAKNAMVFGAIYSLATIYHHLKHIRCTVSNMLTAGAAPHIEPRKDTTTQQSSSNKKVKVIVITGCDRGFGRLLSEQLASEENEDDDKSSTTIVVALCLTTKAAQELTKLNETNRDTAAGIDNENEIVLNNKSAKIVGIQCDVSKDEDVKRATLQIKSILEDNGEGENKVKNAYLHTLVNNAGIVDPGNFLFYNSIKPLERVMQVNYFGMLRVTHSLLPLFLRTSPTYGGRIINITSVCGTTAHPGNSSYNASKFAVEAWSDTIRVELGNPHLNIKVVKIRPGQFSTDIQSDWFHNYKKNFASAPTSIQDLYGGASFVRQVDEIVSKMSSSGGTEDEKAPVVGCQPQQVVDVLKGIIHECDLNQIEPYYWIGNDAHTLWKALYHMPVHVADSVKKLMFANFAPVVQEERKDEESSTKIGNGTTTGSEDKKEA